MDFLMDFVGWAQSQPLNCTILELVVVGCLTGLVFAITSAVRSSELLQQHDRETRAIRARERARDRDRQVVEEATEELQQIGWEAYDTEQRNSMSRAVFWALGISSFLMVILMIGSYLNV
jgi:hypothetical protein